MMDRLRARFGDLLAAALAGGVAASAIVGLALCCHSGGIAPDLHSQRAWKERSVAELLAPLDAQLRRTERAFRSGRSDATLKAGNEAARDLLLTRSHLVPPELRPDADALIEHYDFWLETYEKRRGEGGPPGPIDIAFPEEAARRFIETYHRYLNELYSV